MQLVMSPYLETIVPNLKKTVMDIARESQRIDKDLRTRNLLVTARSHCNPKLYSGLATPITESIYCNRSFLHPDGKVHLSIGHNCSAVDIIRVIAHEFRHIGQFHRGRKQTGELCIILPEPEVELDAEIFEDRILERMGLADEE